jgi:WS/DGAT/MGAT family acyltransferase
MPYRRLSGLDAACLAVESARAPLHTVAVLVLDPSARGADDPADALMEALSATIARSDRLRGTVVEAPLGIALPTLEDEGLPDLEHHLTRIRVPRPGGPRELARVVDDVLSRPLPRGCPLWEMHLVEGLASGAAALVAKLHCVPLDGAAAWHLGLALAGVAPALTRLVASDEADDRAAEPDEGPLGWIRSGPARLVRASAGLLGAAARSLRGTEAGAPPRPSPPEGSRLNAPTTSGRRSAHASLRAATLERVAKSFAVAPDDVVLAAIAGALREELAAAGETHSRPLVAAVVREQPGGTSGWPRINLERLPAHIALPGARLRLIHRDQQSGPDLLPAPWLGVLSDWADATTPVAFSWLARAANDLGLDSRLGRIANLLVTFAPGPDLQPSIEGIRVEHLYPYGPLPEGIHLHLVAHRMGAAVDIGITAAGDVLPEPWRFAVGLGDALRQLEEAALALEG